ncbi:MAG: HNH endonuclease signature motif containing protein [Candidatus Fonsibacter sp.]
MIKKFKLPKYYRLEIDLDNGNIKIFSDSKHAKGRELSQYKSNSGYLLVRMNNKAITIHSIIAELFIGKRPKNLVVNHIDGNKFNNHPNNLEYVTIADNIKHSIENGMHICNRPHLLPTYKDGRCSDIIKYKSDWYIQNRERILLKAKERYSLKKQL